MSTSNITIEQLAEQLGQTIWTKGDLKRIYLNDAGWNTKKMSTKTFIFQTEDGEFKVSCRIECPSQPYQWIQSQEEEVKESIYNDIEQALKLMEITLVDYKVLEEKAEVMVYIRKGENEPIWYTEELFYDEFGKYPENVFPEIPRIVPVPVHAPEVKTVPVSKPSAKIEINNTETPEFGIGSKVKHTRFGEGTIIVESDKMVEVEFSSEGKKQLLKQFAKLERI
jgi:hypothetical protein